MDMNKDSEALDYMLKAHELPLRADREGQLLYNIGVCLMRLDRFKEAAYYLTKSLNSHPYDPESIFALADTYILLKMNDKACPLYKDALRLAGESRETVIKERILKYCAGGS